MSDEPEEEYQDSSKPRKVHYKSKLEIIQDAARWINLRKAQEKGLRTWEVPARRSTVTKIDHASPSSPRTDFCQSHVSAELPPTARGCHQVLPSQSLVRVDLENLSHRTSAKKAAGVCCGFSGKRSEVTDLCRDAPWNAVVSTAKRARPRAHPT